MCAVYVTIYEIFANEMICQKFGIEKMTVMEAAYVLFD